MSHREQDSSVTVCCWQALNI